MGSSSSSNASAADKQLAQSAEDERLFFLNCTSGDHNVVRRLVEKDRSLLTKTQYNMYGIHIAVTNDRYGVARVLLELDPACAKLEQPVVTNNNYGKAHPIHYAAHTGKIDILKLLIENKADVNAAVGGYTPLQLALMANSSNFQCAITLLKKGANPNIVASPPGYSPLPPIHQANNPDVIKLMIQKKADLSLMNSNSNCNVLHTFLMNFTTTTNPIVNILLDCENCPPLDIADNSGFTPFHYAVRSNNLDIVKKMIERGVDPNQRGNQQTPVSLALTSNAHRVLIYLLSLPGCDISSSGSPLIHQLINAPISSNTEDVKKAIMTLIEMGVCVLDEPDPGRQNQSPLMALIATPNTNINDAEFIKTFIAFGADINAPDHQGNSVLTKAITTNKPVALISALLEAGANPNNPDNHGLTAFYYAISQQKEEIVRLLFYNGGDLLSVDKNGNKLVQWLARATQLKAFTEEVRQTCPELFVGLPDSIVGCPARGQISCWQCGSKPLQMVYYLNNAEINRADNFRVMGYSAVCLQHKTYGDTMGNWVFVSQD